MSKPALILRPNVIAKLRTAGIEGLMTQAMNTSQDEVYFAALSIALEFVKMAVANGAELEPLKTMAATLYAEFPKVQVH